MPKARSDCSSASGGSVRPPADLDIQEFSLPHPQEALQGPRTTINADELDRWLSSQLDPHRINTGTVTFDRDPFRAASTFHDRRAERLAAEWNHTTALTVEKVRGEVLAVHEELRMKRWPQDERLREELSTAQEEIIAQFRAEEVATVHRLRRAGGVLRRVPTAPHLWTVEYARAPQRFLVEVTSIRGIRNKLPQGHYAILLSALDVLGGTVLHCEVGGATLECAFPTQPQYIDSSASMEAFVGQTVAMMCPSPHVLRTHACLKVELWKLRSADDPLDQVVAWGMWPLVNVSRNVAEGRFKVPLIVGVVDTSFDTYRRITKYIESSLSNWLGNLYFEIRSAVDEKAIPPRFVGKRDWTQQYEADMAAGVVPNLPPRSFFPVASNDGVSPKDLSAVKMRLWESRRLSEEEIGKVSSNRGLEYAERLTVEQDILRELKQNPLHVAYGALTRMPWLHPVDENKGAITDSHILTTEHHLEISYHRAFLFPGRRYRDRLRVLKLVLLDDLGGLDSFTGVMRLVANLFFLVVGYYGRMLLHAASLLLWLMSQNVVPTTQTFEWAFVDVRWDGAVTLSPRELYVTSIIGTVGCVVAFIAVGVLLFGMLKLFARVPIVVTRLWVCYGWVVVWDPLIEFLWQLGRGIVVADMVSFPRVIAAEEGTAIGPYALMTASFVCLGCIQLYGVYVFFSHVHLNGRVEDTYARLLFPQESFFAPHDLEVAQHELVTAVKQARLFYHEKRGAMKRVVVRSLLLPSTSFFRARLFALLECANIADVRRDWVYSYLQSIPLWRNVGSKPVDHLGAVKLGRDILSFLRRNFPYLMMQADHVVGDSFDDGYFDAELMQDAHRSSGRMDSAREFVDLLEAYVTSVYPCGSAYPVMWSRIDDIDPESTPFKIIDMQWTADLIFFETTSPESRLKLLKKYLGPSESHRKYLLQGMSRGHAQSTKGAHEEGTLVEIEQYNPITGARSNSRVFVCTPQGTLLEPQPGAFTLMKHHTTDDAETWAAAGLKCLR